ncbi:MAG TPA: cytochrome c oxidase assembly protein [Candidatus Limnocylindria bacterium]|nr:cytochrome c oxidase assembly protein [Candidatus Limnocylindria bacterium]
MAAAGTIALALLVALVYARGARASRRWPGWRTIAFFAGLLVVLASLATDLERYAYELFSAHMLQHMLLTIVAAPLLLLGAPITPLLRGLPRGARRGLAPIARWRPLRAVLHALRAPLVAGILYVGGLYYWHIPRVYDAAVEDPLLHSVEHGWYLATALLFWAVVIDPAPFRSPMHYAARIVYLLLAGAAQNTILGGVLAFSSRVFYPHYATSSLEYGLDPLTDQRIGGAIMWVPGDMIFLVAASFAFFRWLQSEEDEQRRKEARA